MDLHDIVLTGPEVQVAKVATLFVRVCQSEILPKSHSHFDMAPIAAVFSGFRNFRTVPAFVLFVSLWLCFGVSSDDRSRDCQRCTSFERICPQENRLELGCQWKKRLQLVELSIHSGNEHGLRSTRFWSKAKSLTCFQRNEDWSSTFRISVVRCIHGRHGEHISTRKALGRPQCCHRFRCLRSPNQLVDLDPDFVVFFAWGSNLKFLFDHMNHMCSSWMCLLIFFAEKVSSEPTAGYRHIIKMSTQKHKITVIWMGLFEVVCNHLRVFSPACFAGCNLLRVAICTAWTEKQKMIGFCTNHFAWITASPNSFTGATHRAKKVITLYLIWCLYLLCMLIGFAKRKPVCCSRSLHAFSII